MAQLLEPVPIDDDLCTALALIEEFGDEARLVFVHEQTVYETGEHVCAVKRKIVLPVGALRGAVEMTVGFLAARRAANAGRGTLHLVR